jgi:hypothetical protein
MTRTLRFRLITSAVPGYEVILGKANKALQPVANGAIGSCGDLCRGKMSLADVEKIVSGTRCVSDEDWATPGCVLELNCVKPVRAHEPFRPDHAS